MTRRAGRLIGMHLLVPGSAQMVAGNRAGGRVVVGVWIALWAIVLAALLTWLVQREVLVAIATSALGLTVIQVGLLLVAVGWLAVTIDVLRLTRLLRLTAWSRPLVASGLVVAAVLGAGAAAWGAYSAGVARGALVSVFQTATPAQAAAAETATEYDVLLLGMDRPRGGGALEPKSVSVVRIDARSGAATIIGVPTTLRGVPFPATSPMHRLYPGGYEECIAAPCTLADVYTEARVVGGALYPDAKAHGTTAAVEAMRDAVSGATGLDVVYTVQVDTTSLGALIDALGGVRVDVPASGASVAFPAGPTRLNGARAVAYLREAVGGNGADQVERVLRVERALLTQANPANALLQFRTVAAASSGALRTDIPQDTVTDLAVLGLRTQTQAVREIRLTPPTVNPSKPDYAAIRRLVRAAGS
ncbi:LytR family transcriptional attenuator [Amnibacterium kyonggiense]|uniref:LytR family transcriptional attenuator n=2 Tax=Amnibacterium kyonggiense TaxID=595671 RepID=A0A4R7FDF1_9MICO|nr:LytR family transcriptional attenuator [Amnibacterium kyonggiense]